MQHQNRVLPGGLVGIAPLVKVADDLPIPLHEESSARDLAVVICTTGPHMYYYGAIALHIAAQSMRANLGRKKSTMAPSALCVPRHKDEGFVLHE